MKMKMRIALVGLCFLLLAAAARATSFTWDGGAGDNNWRSATNWSGNAAPAADGTASLVFSGETRTSANNDFGTNTVFLSITLQNNRSTGMTAAFTLSGNPIILGGDVTATLPTVDGTINDIISLPMLLNGIRTFTPNLSGAKIHSLTLSGNIGESGGAQGLTKAGAGNLTLSGANTYSGKTTVNGGTLYFNSIGNVGAASSALGAPATPENGTIDLNGTLYYTGAAASSDRMINLTSAGVFYNETGGDLLLTGDITGNNKNFTFRGTKNFTQAGLIATGSGALTHTGYGTLTLTCPTNSFSGVIQIFAGTLSADSISDGGVVSALGQGTHIYLGQAGFSNIGTLQFVGSSGGSCNRGITVQAAAGSTYGGIIENTVEGQTLTLSGNVGVAGIATNRLLQLTGAGNGVMSGVLGGTLEERLSIAKTGAGTWSLSGANTYKGTTAVTAGTLLINGLTDPGSAVTVAAGGTLGGTGTVYGTVSVAAGGTLAPGVSGIGTLTLASGSTEALTLNGSAMNCEISDVVGTCDAVAVSGTLVLNGANTIALAFPSGLPPAGSYTLMTYTARSGTGTLTVLPADPDFKIVAGATSVVLTVASESAIWRGDGSANVWDTTTENWSTGTYADNNVVLFDDTGSDSPPVDIAAGTVAPFSVTVDNSVKTYTIGGAGRIGGTGGLTKSGTNTLTLTGTNLYSGTTAVNAGTLTLNGSLSNSSVTVSSGAAFTENAGGVIAGDTVAVICYGTATLSGMNTYGGATTVGLNGISNAYLTVNNNKALGSASAGTTVNGGHTSFAFENKLFLGKDITVTDETLTLSSVSGGRASLHYNQSSGTGTWDGPIVLPSLSSDTYLWSDRSGGTLVIGGSSNDTLTGSNGTLTVRGAGAIVINSRLSIGTTLLTRNDSGSCRINSTGNVWDRTGLAEGTLILGVSDALPPAAKLTLGKGMVAKAVLDLNGHSQQVGGLTENGISGSTQQILSASPATLVVSNTLANTFGANGSSIEGEVTLIKTGYGTLTLTGTNTTAGAFVVSNGTLAVSATGTFGVNSTNIVVGGTGILALSTSGAIADTATVLMPARDIDTAKIQLDEGVSESVGQLQYGNVSKPVGTYGATGSSANLIDDTHFSGLGVLRVLHSTSGTIIRVR